jgi:hypothetical protein
MLSPWNKSHNEVECDDCGCWSPVGEPCWYCTEREEEQTMSYRDTIEQLAPGFDARVIEAWMRVEHPTLDALSATQFAAEVEIAQACALEAGSRDNDALVASFGL